MLYALIIKYLESINYEKAHAPAPAREYLLKTIPRTVLIMNC